MSKIVIIVGFAVMILAQWFVPGHMIYEQEQVLSEGTQYKFKTVPIDPNDPFRGKYITLNYEMDTVKKPSEGINWNEDIYVYIKTDKDGFAVATHASGNLLDTEQDYVITRAYGSYEDTLKFNLPFDILYMDENKAYDAEVAVRRTARDTVATTCYGLVFVKGDKAVLGDVFIDDISIKDYVEMEE